MVYSDPYTPTISHYECRNCGARKSTNDSLETCPECDGRLKNLSVPRD